MLFPHDRALATLVDWDEAEDADFDPVLQVRQALHGLRALVARWPEQPEAELGLLATELRCFGDEVSQGFEASTGPVPYRDVVASLI